jgi:hypothetical protein
MATTTAGRNFIANAIINNGSPVFFTNATSYIGVGDSSTAFNVAQTDLQASTNKLRVGMEATYPQISTNELVFKSSFGDAQANWTWSEWGVFNASTAGTMLTRKVESLGTKVSGTWVITATLTVTAT